MDIVVVLAVLAAVVALIRLYQSNFQNLLYLSYDGGINVEILIEMV
jgi:hypothetical protein